MKGGRTVGTVNLDNTETMEAKELRAYVAMGG